MTTCTICGSVLTVLTTIQEEVQHHECMTCGASFEVEVLADPKLTPKARRPKSEIKAR